LRAQSFRWLRGVGRQQDEGAGHGEAQAEVDQRGGEGYQ
jgi:hypothetical protein